MTASTATAPATALLDPSIAAASSLSDNALNDADADADNDHPGGRPGPGPGPGPSTSNDTAPIPGQHAPAPIDSWQLRELVGGRETELLVQAFDDRVLAVVTQNGKIGCLTQAQLPPFIPLPQPPSTTATAASSSLISHYPPPPPSLALTPLLGAPPSRALNDTYVAQLATLVWWALQEVRAPRRAVVVGLSLQRLGGGPAEDDGGDASGALGEEERERFRGVLEMLARWPGPRA